MIGEIVTVICCLIVAGFLFLNSIVIVRPTERGLIERFGRYNRFALPGLNLRIPFVEKVFIANITEMMADAQKQEIITKDKLNATVDAQIYYKIKPDEPSVKASQYNVNNYEYQIVNLARTTLRNIIGTMNLADANSDRNKINADLMNVLQTETKNWGIEVVRSELKEINPPSDVQETMNRVVKAENEKVAAVDFATANETKADGVKRALVKEAEGNKQAEILVAEGRAAAIKLVNESANKYFKGNAQILKKLETVTESLKGNSKIIVPSNSKLVNLVGNLAGLKGEE